MLNIVKLLHDPAKVYLDFRRILTYHPLQVGDDVPLASNGRTDALFYLLNGSSLTQ